MEKNPRTTPQGVWNVEEVYKMLYLLVYETLLTPPDHGQVLAGLH